MSNSAKQKALDAIEELPESASLDEVMERLYFLSKVERGLVQADAAELIDHQEVRRRFGR